MTDTARLRTTADIALDYIARGLSPVPVPFRQKGPIIPGWQRMRINSLEQVNKYFLGTTNIGVLLGIVSNGVVDVDLDCPEAHALSGLLPKTGSMFGHASNPCSHRLYRVAGPAPSIKCVDPLWPDKKDTIIELRGDKSDGSTGMQTVFPGSVHESGEPIEWEEDGEVASIEYVDLKRIVYGIATLVLVQRYCPHVTNMAEAPAALHQVNPRLTQEIAKWQTANERTAQTSGQQFLSAPGRDLSHLKRSNRRLVGDSAPVAPAPLPFTGHNVAYVWTALTYAGSRDRDVWRDYGAALRDLPGWPEPLCRAMWDKWSIEYDTVPPGGEAKFKASGPNSSDSNWQSFGRNYTGTRITVGTIIYRAQEAGWDGHTFKRLPDALQTFLPAAPTASTGTFEQAASSQQTNISALELELELERCTIRGDELLSTPAPPRRWLVENWIPAAETTMLGGDGGTGKSTLALQLAAVAVSGLGWFGRKVEACNVLYVSAEDPVRSDHVKGTSGEVHFRLEQIAKHLGTTAEQLARVHVMDLAGKDSTVALFNSRDGALKPTPLFAGIEQLARKRRAGCIIFDSVADFFGGNENERREVRAFIGLLRGLAMRLNAAVVIIAHPSVDGIKTGRGYSGSTHWNNAVRSRLYFTKAEAQGEDKPQNPDLRVIELQKSNRARSGEKIYALWWEGHFVLSSAAASRNLASEAKDEELFLQLLEITTRQDVSVGLRHNQTFAPVVFAKMPAAQGTGKAAFEAAMYRLIEQGRIRDEASGPPSKVRPRLTPAVPATPAPGGDAGK